MNQCLFYQSSTNEDKEDDHNGKQISSDFLCEQYPHYLDDIIRLKVEHCDDVKEMNNTLLNQPQHEKYNINESIFIDLHFQISDGLNGDINSY